MGRTYLAHELAKSRGMSFVSLDHQDGGTLSNVKDANNAVLDCEPSFKHAQEVVKYSNKLIYILSAKTFKQPLAHCIKSLEEEIEALTDINSYLEVEFRLSELDKWPEEITTFLGELVTNNV